MIRDTYLKIDYIFNVKAEKPNCISETPDISRAMIKQSYHYKAWKLNSKIEGKEKRSK